MHQLSGIIAVENIWKELTPSTVEQSSSYSLIQTLVLMINSRSLISYRLTSNFSLTRQLSHIKFTMIRSLPIFLHYSRRHHKDTAQLSLFSPYPGLIFLRVAYHTQGRPSGTCYQTILNKLLRYLNLRSNCEFTFLMSIEYFCCSNNYSYDLDNHVDDTLFYCNNIY